MIAVIQRVRSCSILADGAPSGAIEEGLLVLLGVKEGDASGDAKVLSEKISRLRIFEDGNGKMNLSVLDKGGRVAVVSNFTLLANYAHGNRPDYMQAAKPPVAEALYLDFVQRMEALVPGVATGVFGADMRILMEADGPVTVVMDSAVLLKK